jgi:hypothetical protein
MPANGSKDGVEPLVLQSIRMAGKPTNSRWDICCQNGFITSIDESQDDTFTDSVSPFLIPSLCHPHIHLDKCFLLSHSEYADLEIQKGDFAEAMTLTSRCMLQYNCYGLSRLVQVKQSLDLSMMIS